MRAVRVVKQGFVGTVDGYIADDAADRLAFTGFVENDVGTIVRQLDNGSRWRLCACDPVTWDEEAPAASTSVQFVESTADLPAAVGGVRELDAKLYIPIELVDLGTDTLLAQEGTFIAGRAFTRDGFQRTGTPTGALLTVPSGITNFAISHCRLKTPAGEGSLLDVQNGGNFFADRLDCEGDIGNVQGTVVEIADCSFAQFDDGMVVGAGIAFNMTDGSFQQLAGSTGICIDLQGVWQASIDINGPAISVAADGTGIKGLAASGNLGAAGLANLRGCRFSGAAGTGAFLDTLSPDDLKWLHAVNIRIPSSVPVGVYQMFGNSTVTTDPGGAAWTKVLGTTTQIQARRFTHAANKLTFNALSAKLFRVEVNLAGVASATGVDAEFGVSVNGADPTTGWPVEWGQTKPVALSFSEVMELTTDDYIEIWCKNANTADLTIQDLRVIATAVPTGN
jgi:hypothetical protein